MRGDVAVPLAIQVDGPPVQQTGYVIRAVAHAGLLSAPGRAMAPGGSAAGAAHRRSGFAATACRKGHEKCSQGSAKAGSWPGSRAQEARSE